jgi:hypothetical protein
MMTVDNWTGWHEDDLAMLRRLHAEGIHASSIARILKRTPAAIKSKISRLKKIGSL